MSDKPANLDGGLGEVRRDNCGWGLEDEYRRVEAVGYESEMNTLAATAGRVKTWPRTLREESRGLSESLRGKTLTY